MTADRPRIVLLAATESSPSILFGLYDVLVSVGAAFPDMTTGEAGDTLLDVAIVGAWREPFRCYGNILVEPDLAIDDVASADVVIVCDVYTPIHTPSRGRHRAEIEWLRRMHRQGTLIASVCSGSLLLAESGLLDGRSCASHWGYRDLFASAYPRVTLDPNAVLDISSEDDGIITAGGVTAWQDLALHLVGRLCGPRQAAQTAKVFLLARHDEGQLPFAAMSRPPRTSDAAIDRCLAWLEANSATPHPVTAMAAETGLAGRTFARRFLAATGRRPLEYVHAVRIERARELLEAGGSVDDVGAQVGYDDGAFFRRLFKRTTGLSPAAYRRRYASLGGAA
jgi:transcriptional regulator GlxA family with amidase domain